MKSAIALFLLLDLSGSMDQKMGEESRTKLQVLQKMSSQVMQSALMTDQTQVQMMVFGTQPQNGCNDILSLDLKRSSALQKIQGFRAGAYGKTPLARSLRQMGASLKKKRVDDILLLTDGGDSCGEDPCAALLDVDKSLSRSKNKLRFHLIGMDKNLQGSDLQCFLKIQGKLKNIDLNILESKDSSSLLAALAEGMGQGNVKKPNPSFTPPKSSSDSKDLTGAAGDENASDPSKAKNKKANDQSKDSDRSESQDSSAENSSSPEGSKDRLARAAKQLSEKLVPPQGQAILFVQGAPATAQFQAFHENSVALNWEGPLPQILKPGKYKLRLMNPGAESLEIPAHLVSEGKLSISYAQFFKYPLVELMVQVNPLVFRLRPSLSTQLAHGGNAGEVTLENEKTIQLPFGEYSLESVQPWWMNGKFKKNWAISAVQKAHFTKEKDIPEIKWWSAGAEPKATSIGGTKVLVMPGQKIPYLPSSPVKVLKLKKQKN